MNLNLGSVLFAGALVAVVLTGIGTLPVKKGLILSVGLLVGGLVFKPSETPTA